MNVHKNPLIRLMLDGIPPSMNLAVSLGLVATSVRDSGQLH